MKIIYFYPIPIIKTINFFTNFQIFNCGWALFRYRLCKVARLNSFYGLSYIILWIISFMSGADLNYCLSCVWIFKIREPENHYQFFYYAIIKRIGFGINTLLIWCYTEFAGLYFPNFLHLCNLLVEFYSKKIFFTYQVNKG